MSYESFYRYIVFKDGLYYIIKNNENYGSYTTLEDALYERDRLIQVDWNWDLSVELAETNNAYYGIELPPFNHNPRYITYNKESWVVRGKGKEQKYRGVYYSLEEAERVALIYDANVCHRKPSYEVSKRIDGRTRYFGRFKTLEEAEKRVKELEKKEWKL